MNAPPEAERDPLDAPSDRFCDLVMEGGVTSGIIYAAAVGELAGHYRFRNIGGSSIGALAAALAAAAEYRRRHGHRDGFDALASLPGQLAEPGEREDRRTRLERMFVPQPGTRRLFRVFLATLDRGAGFWALLCGLRAALWAYRWHAATVAVLALGAMATPALAVPLCWSGPLAAWQCWVLACSWALAALLVLGVAAAIGTAAGIAWDLGHHAARNGFGLCRGWDAKAKPDSADLAGFLHGTLQTIAGRDPRNAEHEPLTFRDLWDAPGSPTQAFGLASRGAARSINLEVYASNLSHGRPYRFPLDADEDMGRLFFRVEELDDYFPRRVVQFLASVSEPYAPRSTLDPPVQVVGEGYRELPFADLPVVVAARLAMSFPLLISAVPLYAVDHASRSMVRCWMSDGGLCSNFPIHLFDSLMPMWPTFGISLHASEKGRPGGVALPRFHWEGRGETWNRPPPGSTAWTLRGFLLSVWNTTWRWNDSTMMRMPGVRDRVVRIYLGEGEGGVNIRMGPDKIRVLADTYGRNAARAFIGKFREGRGWEEHRWVRIHCALVALRDRIRNFGLAVEMDRHTIPLPEQVMAALERPPLDGREERPLTMQQAAEVVTLTRALQDLEQAFEAAGDSEPYRALPRPSLRMRHPS